MSGPEVRFEDKSSGIVSLLEVATPTRRSVLETVRALLFDLRVQIVRVESIVHETGLLERFHVVEFDGAPIGRRRGAAIRAAVRNAIRAAFSSDAVA
jgi:hypothetical protein